MPRSPRPSTRLDWLRHAETALAATVLVGTWLNVGVALRNYPTWLYVGDVTLPFSVLPPAALAVAVLAAVGVAHRRDRPLGRHRAAMAALAGLTVLAAAYAVVNLNLAEPGVFVAGVFPMFLGLLLAVAVLAGRGVAAVRRRSAA